MHRVVILLCSLLVISPLSYSKEYKSVADLKRQTGSDELLDGDWFKKDRVNNSSLWKQANQFNILKSEGSLEYQSISERRDFYKWIFIELRDKGNEIMLPAMAYVVASQYAKVENGFNKILVPKWFEEFALNGTQKVFKVFFVEFGKVYHGEKVYKDEEAKKWDEDFFKYEQCTLINKLFNGLTEKQLHKMKNLAAGKGIYKLFVKKELRYKYDGLKDCEDRIKYGLEVIMPYAEELLK